MGLVGFLRGLLLLLFRLVFLFILFNIAMTMFMDFDIATKIPSVMGAMYDYSRPDVQRALDTKFGDMCSNIVQSPPSGQTISADVQKMCDPKMIEQAIVACKQFSNLPSQYQTEENRKGCDDVLSGKMQNMCDQAMQSTAKTPEINVTQVLAGCSELVSGQITSRDFFLATLKAAMPDLSDISKIDTSKLPVKIPIPTWLFSKDSQILAKDGFTVAMKCLLLAIIIGMIFIVSNNPRNATMMIAKQFFAFSFMILISIAAVNIWVVYFPPDTSFILENVLSGSSSFDFPKVLITLLPLVLIQFFTNLTVAFGVACLFLGIALFVLARTFPVKVDEPLLAK